MQIIKDQNCLVCFSDAHDGDLSFYLDDRAEAGKNWKSLEVVRNYKLRLPAWLCQVHDNRVVTLEDYDFDKPFAWADGVITDKVNIPIGVFSADCLPVILWSHKAVGAVHAGWKGSLKNISGAAISRMVDAFSVEPGLISAALGPCIKSCCLELGEDIYEDFVAKDPAYKQFFTRKNKWHLDMTALNRFQLIEAGIDKQKIKISEKCTFCRNDDFFSFRRQKRRNGSMFSFVVKLEPE